MGCSVRAVATCFAGAAAYVWIINPTDIGASDVPTCIVKLTTGLDCPGCGGTRAFYYLLHGNLPEAARHHAMAVFAAPFLVWLFVAWSVKRIWASRSRRRARREDVQLLSRHLGGVHGGPQHAVRAVHRAVRLTGRLLGGRLRRLRGLRWLRRLCRLRRCAGCAGAVGATRRNLMSPLTVRTPTLSCAPWSGTSVIFRSLTVLPDTVFRSSHTRVPVGTPIRRRRTRYGR